MVHAIDHGVNSTGHSLECPSDYPAVDIQPVVPVKPAWPDHLARYTHSLTWFDTDGCSHSLTIRSDTLQDLMRDLKLVKAGIKHAKGKAATASPGADYQHAEPEHIMCKIHNVEMERRVSKRTGGHYHAHKMGPRDLCFGREKS